MTRTVVTRTINAPVDLVFRTISNIDNYSKAVPHILGAEIISDIKSGIGTRFIETRLMNGKEATTELEVTEYVENEHVRIVADVGGTVWDTLFAVRSVGGRTELTMTMDARAYELLATLMNPLIKGTVQKAIEDDLDAVKAYCESQA